MSVIIPVYNQEKYIKECVKSVLSQDYENLEVIVVDDGSTDATPEILKSFGEKICYIYQDNRGAAAALNVGLRLTQGSLVAWLSSDDLYLPGKITSQVQKLQENPSLGLVYTDWTMIDAEGRELQTVCAPCPPAKAFAREMLKGNFINGSSVLIKKECFKRVGYFDERLPADVDGDMWFRLLKQGYHFGHVPRLLLKYRWHSGNLSHNYHLMQACKDQVRLKVIETFSIEQLFGDLLKDGSFNEGEAYEKLAWTVAKDFNFRAARFALQKSSHANRSSLRRIFLAGTLRVMDTKIFLAILSRVRKMRRVWLDRRQISKFYKDPELQETKT